MAVVSSPSSVDKVSIIKVAKKTLKKNGDMKLQDLAKIVTEKLESMMTAEQVAECIRNESKKFSVIEGNVVRLTKKKSKKKRDRDLRRSSSPHDPNEELAKACKKIKVDKIVSDDSEDFQKWRKDNKIILAVSPSSSISTDDLNQMESFFPLTSFSSSMSFLAPSLVRHCTSVGYERPSPIQAQSWPILLQQRDVVGIAETGSGKTAGFALPALTQMMNDTSTKQPRMLVLSPTRELAMQTDKVLQEFGAVVGLKSIVIYGGVPKYTQVSQLKRGGIDCVVATPGRLKDLIEEQSIRLDAVQYLVLDEADRMLDMGFEDDVRFIISHCKSKEEGRQTAMYSATWPAAIQNISAEYMRDPIRIYVGFESNSDSEENNNVVVDDCLSANKRVQQIVEVLDDHQRPSRLREILRKVHTNKDRVLVFGLYKKEAERLEISLRRDGWHCCSIHGNKNQDARTLALQQFKDGSCPLLIATDVAARGLDIPNVETVINYTFPLTIEDYCHRIGRTGRAGKTGVSYTFFQPTDKARAGELQQIMRQAGQDVPEALLKFGSTIKKKEHKLYGNFGPSSDSQAKKATKITFNYSDDEEE